jgi:hypothetical protein
MVGEDRLETDEWGLDELVVSGCDVHIERMDKNSIWVGVSKGDKRISMFLTAPVGTAIEVADGDGTFDQWKEKP